MTRQPRLSSSSNDTAKKFDLFICAVGFESRATAASERCPIYSSRKIAYGFTDRKELAFTRNLSILRARGFSHVEVSDRDFQQALSKDLCDAVNTERRSIRVGIDISCFNRYRLAVLVDTIRKIDVSITEVEVAFFYTLAKYSPPSEKKPANVHVGPVSKEFAGWTTNPSLPPAAIVGLGYEQDRALGALEHLQVPHVIALLPSSSIAEYDQTLRIANSSLLGQLRRDHILKYRVEDPVATYVTVESIANGLKNDFNPILLPFGPKIFFVSSILAACRHPGIAVWRVSAGASEEAVDREPSDSTVNFTVRFDCTSA